MKVGCFGKLPLSPEFIRVNTSGEALKAFDQWLQEGIQYARTKQRRWSEDFLNMDTWNFMFASPDHKDLLIGILSPNQDRAGRTFPFLLFICADKSELTNPWHFVPAMFSEFLQQARELVETGWRDKDVQWLRSRIQEIELPEPKDQQDAYEAYLQSHDAHQFFDDVFVQQASPTNEKTREFLHRHLVSLSDDLGATTDSSIRIPLESREPLCAFDVVFWIEVVSRLWSRGKMHDMVFWVSEPKYSKPYLFMTAQPTPPKTLLSLVQASHQDQHSTDEGDAVDGLQSIPQEGGVARVAEELTETVIEEHVLPGISLTSIRNALNKEMIV